MELQGVVKPCLCGEWVDSWMLTLLEYPYLSWQPHGANVGLWTTTMDRTGHGAASCCCCHSRDASVTPAVAAAAAAQHSEIELTTCR
jgi:hypothetical protein